MRSDQPSEEDLLGFGEDVETLAALVTATATEPPLAIALLGDWGAGKSSVMQQMQRQVQHLADLSLNNLGLSSFAANVRQVSFNAWHYSDDRPRTGRISPRRFRRPTLRPEATQPRPSGAGDDPTAIPDLRPQGLQMSPQEIDFMAGLGRLLPTPRAAKKLVNLYRLIRIGIRDGDLPAFLADHSYQPVQVLLALLVGTPNDARLILTP